MLKIFESQDGLIFNMGIPILERGVFILRQPPGGLDQPQMWNDELWCDVIYLGLGYAYTLPTLKSTTGMCCKPNLILVLWKTHICQGHMGDLCGNSLQHYCNRSVGYLMNTAAKLLCNILQTLPTEPTVAGPTRQPNRDLQSILLTKWTITRNKYWEFITWKYFSSLWNKFCNIKYSHCDE